MKLALFIRLVLQNILLIICFVCVILFEFPSKYEINLTLIIKIE